MTKPSERPADRRASRPPNRLGSRPATADERRAVTGARKLMSEPALTSWMRHEEPAARRAMDMAGTLHPGLEVSNPIADMVRDFVTSQMAPVVNLASLHVLDQIAPALDLAATRVAKDVLAPLAVGLNAYAAIHVPRIEVFATSVGDSLFSALSQSWAPRVDWTLITRNLIDFEKVVGGTLRLWRDLAHEDASRRAWARRALRAALRAKQAAMQGRMDLVRLWILDWLDVRRPQWAHVQAATDALLEPGWDIGVLEAVDDPDVAGDMLDILNRSTRTGTRGWRFINQTQINGRPVAMLDRPRLTPDRTDAGTLLDLVAAKPEPEDIGWGVEDPRLRHALALLNPNERAVCIAYGGAGLTWEQAAVAAGFPPEFGETVRRKRKRVAAEVTRRVVARLGTAIPEGR